MTNLTVAADFGASLGRAMYANGSNQPELVLLAPELICLSKSSIETYEKSLKLSASYPEDSAWVKVGQKYYVLGELAKYRFRVKPYVDEPKYNKAICQSLGIIGSILQRNKLSPHGLNLAILLPYDEFKYKEEFEEQLRKSLLNFTFRGQDFSVKLNKFICLPEGSGLYLRGRAARKGELLPNPKEITIAVIMIGYRNISLMVIDRGTIRLFETTMQGFAQMMVALKERVPVTNEQSLVEAICQARKGRGRRAFYQVAECRDASIRIKEVEKLERAVKEARAEYFDVVSDFLSVKLKPFKQVDEFVVGGGTANYLKKELTSYLSKFPWATITWTEAIEERVRHTFAKQIDQYSLERRLCDVYGLFYYALNQPLP